jgi:hypothetical protein
MGSRLLEGRPSLARRRIGTKSLDAFSSRFWLGWVTRRGAELARTEAWTMGADLIMHLPNLRIQASRANSRRSKCFSRLCRRVLSPARNSVSASLLARGCCARVGCVLPVLGKICFYRLIQTLGSSLRIYRSGLFVTVWPQVENVPHTDGTTFLFQRPSTC